MIDEKPLSSGSRAVNSNVFALQGVKICRYALDRIGCRGIIEVGSIRIEFRGELAAQTIKEKVTAAYEGE